MLNLAVGGHWPGPPEASTPIARILVDFTSATTSRPRLRAQDGGFTIAVRAGETASGTVHLTSTIGTGHVSLSCSGAPAGSACAQPARRGLHERGGARRSRSRSPLRRARAVSRRRRARPPA
jgi:hypothetical protein